MTAKYRDPGQNQASQRYHEYPFSFYRGRAWQTLLTLYN
jgi:hypothetical protein